MTILILINIRLDSVIANVRFAINDLSKVHTIDFFQLLRFHSESLIRSIDLSNSASSTSTSFATPSINLFMIQRIVLLSCTYLWIEIDDDDTWSHKSLALISNLNPPSAHRSYWLPRSHLSPNSIFMKPELKCMQIIIQSSVRFIYRTEVENE